jgi:hypothetical protein
VKSATILLWFVLSLSVAIRSIAQGADYPVVGVPQAASIPWEVVVSSTATLVAPNDRSDHEITRDYIPSVSFEDLIEELFEVVTEGYVFPEIEAVIDDILDDWQEYIDDPFIQIIGGGIGISVFVPFHDDLISELDASVAGLPFVPDLDLDSIPLPSIDISEILGGEGVLDINVHLDESNRIDGFDFEIEFVY